MNKRPSSGLPDSYSVDPSPTYPNYELETAGQLEQLLRDLKVPKGAKILELAAGTGQVSLYLASKGYATTVTDFSEDAVKKARENYEKNRLQGHFQVFDILDEPGTMLKHDVVFIAEVLDHYDGSEVVKVLERMRRLGQLVVILSQNPKCIPYLLYDKIAKASGDWRTGLSIFRESFVDLVELAGLEVIEDRYFSAPDLTKLMAKLVSSEMGKLYDRGTRWHLVPEDQMYFRVLAARPRSNELRPDEKLVLSRRVYENELKALHQAYNSDIQVLGDRASNLEEELVTKINSIRQLELVQQYADRMIRTPMGLLLSLYYERTDLQNAFPEVVNHDYKRLLQWAEETVDGKTGDYSTNKLREFGDWYRAFSISNVEKIAHNPMVSLLSLYYERTDLQNAFPEVVNHDYKRLLQWAQDTVNGKTGDSNTDKLLRFADWYRIVEPLDKIVFNEKSDPLSVVLALYLTRTDLQNAFPEVVNHDYKRLLQWAQDTVNGKTGDSNTDKLLRFADWYNNAPKNSETVRNSVPKNNTIEIYLQLLRNLKFLKRLSA